MPAFLISLFLVLLCTTVHLHVRPSCFGAGDHPCLRFSFVVDCCSMLVHWLFFPLLLPAVVCAKMNALVSPLHVVRLFCRYGLRSFLCSLFFFPFPLRFSPLLWVTLCFDAVLPVSIHLVLPLLRWAMRFVVLALFAVCTLLYLDSRWNVECLFCLLRGCRSLSSSRSFSFERAPGQTHCWQPSVLGACARCFGHCLAGCPSRTSRSYGRHGRSLCFVCQLCKPCLERSPPLRESASFPVALHWV